MFRAITQCGGVSAVGDAAEGNLDDDLVDFPRVVLAEPFGDVGVIGMRP
jgi:hypothetical protein